jgi:diketogulonate reductase-like aldo/keto reductase/histidinol phosphatase-like enzyme
LRSWRGDRSAIEVATKGGMTRPDGKWVPDGRARHLRAACEASLAALGVEAIDLYQLHAVDPRTPLETSVRALAALQHEGMIRRIGLCNVNVGQIAAARQIADIASVQVSLSVLDDDSLRNGVAEYCRDEGIRLIAHRPLGGERAARLSRLEALRDVAARHGATPHEVALAWLMDLSPVVVPVPGATRVESASSLGRVLEITLGDDDRRRLDEAFSGRLLRVPRSARRAPDGADGEVVLVMGMPGAGKSTIAGELVTAGYERLNRDERGGSLAGLLPALDAGLLTGRKRWVLDNTYPTRTSRNEVIECAWRHGVPVRCIHLTTSVADAQVNAVARMIEVHGRLPAPEELRELAKSDPRYLGPDAQFRYERAMEPPDETEGFTAVERRAFEHRGFGGDHPAVVLEFDDVLCAGTPHHPDDVTLSEGIAGALRRRREEGWVLLAHAWRPGIARGEVPREVVEACFARTRELLGAELTLACCPHDAGPPVCWCRKPMPGTILEFALARGVSLTRSLYVGRSAADRTLAARLGMTYLDLPGFLTRR